MPSRVSLLIHPLRTRCRDVVWCNPQRLKRLFRKEPPPSLPLAQRQLVIGLGAMKSGTTWLSDYLGSHPAFFHSPIKEMNAFAALFPENSCYPGYIYKPGEAYRLWRMERIVLSFGQQPPRLDRSDAEIERFDRLRALAQLGRIASTDDYLGFSTSASATRSTLAKFRLRMPIFLLRRMPAWLRCRAMSVSCF